MATIVPDDGATTASEAVSPTTKKIAIYGSIFLFSGLTTAITFGTKNVPAKEDANAQLKYMVAPMAVVLVACVLIQKGLSKTLMDDMFQERSREAGRDMKEGLRSNFTTSGVVAAFLLSVDIGTFIFGSSPNPSPTGRRSDLPSQWFLALSWNAGGFLLMAMCTYSPSPSKSIIKQFISVCQQDCPLT